MRAEWFGYGFVAGIVFTLLALGGLCWAYETPDPPARHG